MREATESAPAQDFVSRVVEVVESIPPGRVMTYGDVASAVGSRAARAVGRTMSHYGHDLPWWRVVHADGRPPAAKAIRALERLRSEGAPLLRTASGTERVDLAAARHSP